MHIVIGFKSSKFDVTAERKNPINPIYGESLLTWLKTEVENELLLTEPDAEDWGWYCYTEWKGRSYMLGASSYFEKGDDPKAESEWVLQIEKVRTLKEKILGREKISKSDDCVLFFKSKLEADPQINSVAFE